MSDRTTNLEDNIREAIIMNSRWWWSQASREGRDQLNRWISLCSPPGELMGTGLSLWGIRKMSLMSDDKQQPQSYTKPQPSETPALDNDTAGNILVYAGAHS